MEGLMPPGLSSKATHTDLRQDLQPRQSPVYGLCVHTCGEGIIDDATHHGVDPLEYVVAHYLTPGEFAGHYVINYDGHIVQVADENSKAQHVGLTPADHANLLTDGWISLTPAKVVAAWKKAWPGTKAPAFLFPGPSANQVYVGAEMLPLPSPNYLKQWKPAYDGARYTQAQHDAVAALAADIASRWSLPSRWQTTSRLLGHEDLNPIQRPGWDPGALRDSPWFDYVRVKKAIEALS